MRPIRLLIITDMCVDLYGGSEVHLYAKLILLNKDMFKITVLQLKKISDPSFALFSKIDGVKAIGWPTGRIYGKSGISAYFKLQEVIEQDEPDILVSFHEKSDLMNLLTPRRNGRLVKISSRRDMGFNRSSLIACIFKVVDKYFDVITSPSIAILNKIAEESGVNREHLTLIRNGIDLNRFKVGSEKEKSMFKCTMSVNQNSFVISCIGNLKPIKGHVYLLHAIQKLKQSNHNVHLLLVGEGHLRQELEALVDSLGISENVGFLSYRRDVDAILRGSDLAVCSSLSEGLSNSLLEALATGLPVVATRVGGNPEIVCDNENGFLVEAGDSEALYRAIEKLICSKSVRDKFGRRSREIAENKFDLGVMVSAYEHLYTRMMTEKWEN